jgi:hypothetical protein
MLAAAGSSRGEGGGYDLDQVGHGGRGGWRCGVVPRLFVGDRSLFIQEA